MTFLGGHSTFLVITVPTDTMSVFLYKVRFLVYGWVAFLGEFYATQFSEVCS